MSRARGALRIRTHVVMHPTPCNVVWNWTMCDESLPKRHQGKRSAVAPSPDRAIAPRLPGGRWARAKGNCQTWHVDVSGRHVKTITFAGVAHHQRVQQWRQQWRQQR